MRGERGIIPTMLYFCGCVGLLAACSGKPVKPDPGSALSLAETQPHSEPPSRYGNPETYTVFGRDYRVKTTSAGYRERGLASWYGADFHGKRTSSGTPYDMYAVSAAHKSLPIPTYVRVTRLDNGRSIVVRVDDRGPFVDERVIDLSYGAARQLDMVEQGIAPVEVVALAPYQYLARHQGPRDPGVMLADTTPPATPLPAVRTSSVAQPPTALAPAITPDPGLAATLVGNAYLQVGAFSQRERAEQLRQLLAGTMADRVHLAGGKDDLHRVRVGPLGSLAEVDQTRLVLAELGIRQAYLIHD